ncbi:hypothetical protein PQX77_000241 [Marasmius sp. AFHP31]|nr:hypothetical protein PQX77_000241 [Marasmius sp. AFHP31]
MTEDARMMSSDNLAAEMGTVRESASSSGKPALLRSRSTSSFSVSAKMSIPAPKNMSGGPDNEGGSTTETVSNPVTRPRTISLISISIGCGVYQFQVKLPDDNGQQPVKGNGPSSTPGTNTNDPPDSRRSVRDERPTQISVPEKPTLEASWEAIEKEMRSLEEGWMGGWKDDIDTLLVFAGLFSAVVTAFVVESYQWLEEAPEDATVALLRQIFQQMNGSAVSPPSPPFEPSPFAVRVNILWFLSLTIGLVVALVGLLCKQWVRELRRPTHTHSPSDTVAGILLRTWSADTWHVSTIITSLPLLLELALFLFFAGLLDLLHNRHPAPFAAVMSIVITAGLFYLATTLIPTVDFIGKFFRLSTKLDCRFPVVDDIMTLPVTEDTCPYRSPQAWAIFQSFTWVSFQVPGIVRALYSLCIIFYPPRHGEDPQNRFVRWREHFHAMIHEIDEWPDLFHGLQRSNKGISPPLKELHALDFLARLYSDSPAITPYIQTILESMPLNLVMPAILSQWFYLPDRQWVIGDIDAALRMVRTGLTVNNHLSYAKADFLNHLRGDDRAYNQFLHWTHVCMNIGDSAQSTVHIPDPPLGAHLPFSRIDNLLKDPNSSLDGPRAIGSRLWSIFTEIARNTSCEEACWGALMQDLAQYIVISSPSYTFHEKTATTTSPFVESVEGLEFLDHMHKTALGRDMKFLKTHDGVIQWVEAMNIVRSVHQLSEDHFPPIPGLFPLSPRILHRTLIGLSSIDPGLDFEYLRSYIRHWNTAQVPARMDLIRVLSTHINRYPESATQPPAFADPSTISPLVASSAGLELVAFVNTRLAEERETYDQLGDRGRTAWREALERVRTAHPELPPDFFTPISHEGIDPSPSAHQPLQGKVETQADGVISTVSPEVHGGESKGGDETTGGPTAFGLSIEFRHDDKVPLNDGSAAIGTEGGIPTETLTVRDTAVVLTDGGEARFGGPDADKKV